MPFSEGLPTPEKAKAINEWVKNNADIYTNSLVKMYHATHPSIPIEHDGLRPTSTLRRRSYQSESGYVYLAATPERAKAFGDIANGTKSTVYEVLVRVRHLLPDKDQLNNQRSVGNELGNSVGESVVYGGGARVKGRIEPWAVRKIDESEMAAMRAHLLAQDAHQVSELVLSGEHYGPIKAINGNQVVQSAGRNGEVTHDLRVFMGGAIPKEGQNVAIKYGKNGKAVVTVIHDLNPSKSLGR